MAAAIGTMADMDRCPRCRGNLFAEPTYTPLLGVAKEVYCLQCGYRENKPYEGIVLAKKRVARHERGYRRRVRS